MNAQQATDTALVARPAGSCTIDTAAYRRILDLTVWLDAGVDPANTSDRAVAARALVAVTQQEFRAPTVPLPSALTAFDPAIFLGAGLLTGTVTIKQVPGQPMTFGWDDEPGWAALQRSMDSALTRAGRNPEYADAVAALPRKAYRFPLQVRTEGEPPAGRGLALLRVHVPYLAMSSPAARIGGPFPVYPASEAASRTSGFVDFQYLVTADGHAEPGSLVVLRAAGPAFLAPARNTILNTIFKPAMVGGCPAPQQVRQRVVFRAP